LDVCTKEMDALKPNFTPESADGKKLAELQADGSKQVSAVVKMDEGVREALKAADSLKPEAVAERVRAEKTPEGQRLGSP